MTSGGRKRAAEEVWSKVVSASRPATFDAGSGILELKSCCQAASNGGPSALFCALDGQPRFALGRVADGAPSCSIKVFFKQENVTFTCEGGDVLLVGLSRSNGARPKKVARTEASAKGGAAAAAAAPAAAKAVPASTPAKGASSSAAAPSEAAKEEPEAKAAPAAQKAAPKADAKAEGQPLSKSAKKRQRKKEAAAKAAAAAGAGSPGAAPAAAAATPKPEAAQKPVGKDAKEGPALTRRQLPSGLQYEVLKAGRGPEQAASGKTVQVRYEGRLASNGQRFDKGVIKFRLGVGEVISGWDQGVKGMLKGERRRLLVPSRLGYGSQGAPPAIPRNANLIFDVELVGC